MLPGGTTNDEQTMEDRATQPLGCWKAEFRNLPHLEKLSSETEAQFEQKFGTE